MYGGGWPLTPPVRGTGHANPKLADGAGKARLLTSDAVGWGRGPCQLTAGGWQIEGANEPSIKVDLDVTGNACWPCRLIASGRRGRKD